MRNHGPFWLQTELQGKVPNDGRLASSSAGPEPGGTRGSLFATTSQDGCRQSPGGVSARSALAVHSARRQRRTLTLLRLHDARCTGEPAEILRIAAGRAVQILRVRLGGTILRVSGVGGGPLTDGAGGKGIALGIRTFERQRTSRRQRIHVRRIRHGRAGSAGRRRRRWTGRSPGRSSGRTRRAS